MIWWKLQEGEEGKKKWLRDIAELTGIGIKTCLREAEDQGKWRMIVTSSKADKGYGIDYGYVMFVYHWS